MDSFGFGCELHLNMNMHLKELIICFCFAVPALRSLQQFPLIRTLPFKL